MGECSVSVTGCSAVDSHLTNARSLAEHSHKNRFGVA